MNLPNSFIDYTRPLMGEERFNRFVAAFDEDTPVSVRLNPKKTGCLLSDAVAEPDGATPVPWCDGGYYLAERPNFTFDPLLHAGCYYVQEAASMFVWRALRQYAGVEPLVCLDMCAAPGGKTTAAMTALPAGSIVVCNEPIRQRANILAENIQKWGWSRVAVTNNYPADIARTALRADVIICDVPCSGEGMFRKDEGAIAEWSVQNVENCARLQREIVAEAWKILRPGGLMIYSTCTFNTKENEENVRWICDELGAAVLPVDVKDEWNITGSLLDGFDKPVYRFIPGTTKGEGLFMAVLRKGGEDDGAQAAKKAKADKNNKKNSKQNARLGDVKLYSQWLQSPQDYNIIRCGDSIAAIHLAMQGVFDSLSPLRIVHAGITLGEVKGKDIIPSQSLALSTELLSEAFPRVELDYRQAIDYLRKETITLPDGTPRGHVLVCFRGVPLGFMKNIGNRANNLYPQEWKIKSTHIPDEQTVLPRI